jgi:hypothetical protein
MSIAIPNIRLIFQYQLEFDTSPAKAVRNLASPIQKDDICRLLHCVSSFPNHSRTQSESRELHNLQMSTSSEPGKPDAFVKGNESIATTMIITSHVRSDETASRAMARKIHRFPESTSPEIAGSRVVVGMQIEHPDIAEALISAFSALPASICLVQLMQ